MTLHEKQQQIRDFIQDAREAVKDAGRHVVWVESVKADIEQAERILARMSKHKTKRKKVSH